MQELKETLEALMVVILVIGLAFSVVSTIAAYWYGRYVGRTELEKELDNLPDEDE